MLKNAVEEVLGVRVLDRSEHQLVACARVIEVIGAKVIEPILVCMGIGLLTLVWVGDRREDESYFSECQSSGFRVSMCSERTLRMRAPVREFLEVGVLVIVENRVQVVELGVGDLTEML